MEGVVAILGAGGHGQDIADIARECGLHPIMLDDSGRLPPTDRVGDLPYVVGVNDPLLRRRMAVGSTPTRLIHPTAVVSPTAILGAGVVIGPNTWVGPNTVLNDHVHVNAGCTITRSLVGAYTTISPGVDIAGDCRIGPGCFIGVGARIANLTTIGRFCRIGAGAVVVRDLAAGETVVTRDLTATGAST